MPVSSAPLAHSPWRAFAVLGRVSNLPTVWSNCLAGWWLAGGGPVTRLLALGLGATAVYLGGMFLNDAFDAEFDRRRRPERPIPAGAIAAGRVWQWGLGLLAFGGTTLALLGGAAPLLSLLLVAAVLAYDALHKRAPLAVGLIAGCRLLLYLLAAAAAGGIHGLVLWFALALAAYVMGLSLIARHEVADVPPPRWPLVLLAAPLPLAWFANEGQAWEQAMAVALLLILWTLPFLRQLLRRPVAAPALAVSGLLAGIVLVDFLAVVAARPAAAPAFLGCFALALLGQRYVPAT